MEGCLTLILYMSDIHLSRIRAIHSQAVKEGKVSSSYYKTVICLLIYIMYQYLYMGDLTWLWESG